MEKKIIINKEISERLSKNPDFILPKEEKWDLIMRLSRSSGHLASIRSMIYQDEDPKIVMSQLLAIKGAINALERRYMGAYLSLAKKKLIEDNNDTYIDETKELIEVFLK